jgi:hypothetical protein
MLWENPRVREIRAFRNVRNFIGGASRPFFKTPDFFAASLLVDREVPKAGRGAKPNRGRHRTCCGIREQHLLTHQFIRESGGTVPRLTGAEEGRSVLPKPGLKLC